MRKPSKQQKAILDHEARIRIVRAVPGSGKTWLVGEQIATYLEDWNYTDRGVAALSFTNAAGEEIKNALGGTPSHPHFIGTLDSFIYRYIVRPFSHLYDPRVRQISLVPANQAEVLEEKHKWLPNSSIKINSGLAPGDTHNVFTASFLKEKTGEPTFLAQPSTKGLPRNVVVEGQKAREILGRKVSVWRHSGMMSHSDTVYVAREILRNQEGSQVLRLLEKRFPFLIVDELQDTGWYMGEVVIEMIRGMKNSRFLLVGDPEQAIYEFSGATSSLFKKFEDLDGAQNLPLTYSRRCPDRVRKIADELSAGEHSIQGSGDEGKAFVVPYQGRGDSELREFCRRMHEQEVDVDVLVRRRSSERRILGKKGDTFLAFGSPPLQKLYNAALALKRGSSRKAIDLAGCVLSRAVFGTECLTLGDLERAAIPPAEWRRLVTTLLLEAQKERVNEDLYDWAIRQHSELKALLGADFFRGMDLSVPRRPIQKNLKGKKCWPEFQERQALSCSTVHKAKGKTLPTVLYVIENPSEKEIARRCPSHTWWDPDSEERRICYVAATRSSENLIFYVREEVYDRVDNARPRFWKLFQKRDSLSDIDL